MKQTGFRFGQAHDNRRKQQNPKPKSKPVKNEEPLPTWLELFGSAPEPKTPEPPRPVQSYSPRRAEEPRRPGQYEAATRRHSPRASRTLEAVEEPEAEVEEGLEDEGRGALGWIGHGLKLAGQWYLALTILGFVLGAFLGVGWILLELIRSFYGV